MLNVKYENEPIYEPSFASNLICFAVWIIETFFSHSQFPQKKKHWIKAEKWGNCLIFINGSYQTLSDLLSPEKKIPFHIYAETFW